MATIEELAQSVESLSRSVDSARAEMDRLRGALDELASAVQDGLRRHAAGDPNAIASNLISATLRQAVTVLRKPAPFK